MIYSMFAMVLLTFGIALYMFKLRVNAVRSGQVKLSYFRLNTGAEAPPHLTQAARNYSNLFEMPLLFYVAATLALALNLESAAMVILSWLFVAARIAHSWIHLTSNNVIHRLTAFMFGNICVLLIWILILWEYHAH
jgi:hypothetical protein